MTTTDPDRRYADCPRCGGRGVLVTVTPTPDGRERVVVTCAECRRQRTAYVRRWKLGPRTPDPKVPS